MKRRRWISIMAATAGGLGASCRQGAGEPKGWRWTGVLFNSNVELTLHGLRDREAEALSRACVEEMLRLEGIFSLYQPQSSLCRLNRDGVLANPPREFRELVGLALALSEATGGAFDPTIQPYWTSLREASASGQGWAEGEQQRQLDLVDYRQVQLAADRVEFGRPEMGMTLNGVAQGYITDRVGSLLREAGARHCLVNLGEYGAIGPHPSGRPWEVAIRGHESAPAVSMVDGALAVSSGSGHFFGTGTSANHLIDPRNGRCSHPDRTVVVTAADATTADALSTAAAVLDDASARRLERCRPGVGVRLYRSRVSGGNTVA